MKHLRWVGGAVLALLVAGSAQAVTPAPAQKCQEGKNKEAGTYASCRQKAEAKFALTGDGAVRAATLAKCSDKYGLKWSAIEAKAAGTCPSMGDQVAIRGCLDATTTGVADGLAGNALVCGQSGSHFQPLKTGQAQCWDTTNNYVACAGTGQDGELQKGLTRAYVDNGDGTITDTRMGLMWEKLSHDGSIHDGENYYTWADAFAVKVATLNAGGGFAGHIDWRLPNINELQSLVNFGAAGPAVSPEFNTGCSPLCTVLTCSCTPSYFHWSSTTYQYDPNGAWYVFFFGGDVGVGAKNGNNYVRAVRGGS